VTTDGHDAYPRSIRETLDPAVMHRTSRYKNSRIEQDHRGIKLRYYPMRGFGNFASAASFCIGYEKQRQYFRQRTRRYQCVTLADQLCWPRTPSGAIRRKSGCASARIWLGLEETASTADRLT
jgi:hypothetical protein